MYSLRCKMSIRRCSKIKKNIFFRFSATHTVGNSNFTKYRLLVDLMDAISKKVVFKICKNDIFTTWNWRKIMGVTLFEMLKWFVSVKIKSYVGGFKLKIMHRNQILRYFSPKQTLKSSTVGLWIERWKFSKLARTQTKYEIACLWIDKWPVATSNVIYELYTPNCT